MSICWITSLLGTGPFPAFDDTIDATIIDVRDLVDKEGNENLTILKKIEQGVDALNRGKKVIVCCDCGISRSNAVAAGILASFEKRNFHDSLRQVLKATGETQVKLEPIKTVRGALGFHMEKKRLVNQGSILVTAGDGFLGHALLVGINDDFRVLTPARAEIDITRGSTLLDLLVDEEGIDCIVHLDKPRIYTSSLAMGQTLTMLRNIIDVCLSRDIPLVYPSSWEIYSGYKGVLRADEATPPLPRGPYGETNYLSETLIAHFVRTAGLRCALMRSTPIYGKGGDRPKFINNFTEKALQSKPIVTHRYRNGEPAMDMLYVDDFVTAVVAVLKSGFTGTLNLGTGLLTSTRQIAQMISEKLHSRSKIEQVSINADVACIAMNWDYAQKEIGWEPKIPMEKGIDFIVSDIWNKRSKKNGL
jgi:nucleoside-diphosphate-sugar epimerase/rhodanese-related sulfurtransferase